MSPDLLEQLAEVEVPPPPAQFDAQIHDRLNRTLLVQQLVDFAVGALPLALVHYLRGVLALVTYTVTGRFDARDEKRRRAG